MARKYTLKNRARKQEQTRERILDAVVALHEELGPAQTSISAIAERAGVQSLTVYRHFPDEAEMFEACRDHWMAMHPFPDMKEILNTADPRQRLRAGLHGIYDYYERTEQMTANIIRDAGVSDTVAQAMSPFVQAMGALHQALCSGWDVSGEQQRLLNAVIGHALDFSTWQSLARGQGLPGDQIAELMVCLVDCALGRE